MDTWLQNGWAAPQFVVCKEALNIVVDLFGCICVLLTTNDKMNYMVESMRTERNEKRMRVGELFGPEPFNSAE